MKNLLNKVSNAIKSFRKLLNDIEEEESWKGIAIFILMSLAGIASLTYIVYNFISQTQ